MSNKNKLRSLSSVVSHIEKLTPPNQVNVDGNVFSQIIEKYPNLSVREFQTYAEAFFIRQPKDLADLITIKRFK